MRKRAFRPLTMMLSLILAVSTTVQAGPISITEVVQVLGKSSGNRLPELRLRNVSQTSSLFADNDSTKSAGATSQTASNQLTSVDLVDSTIGAAPNASDSLLAGVAISSDTAQNVDVISQGDLEGSICDCGEIPIVEEHHHVPKWPLLFLAVIPLFFIHHHDCDTCTSTPTPTPTPTPPGVPEPTSLLLMGSGLAALGAGLRRRYSRAKLEQEIASTEEA